MERMQTMKLKKPTKEKPKIVTIKIYKYDLSLLKAQAARYADGNLSWWLRYAGLNHVPKREDSQ